MASPSREVSRNELLFGSQKLVVLVMRLAVFFVFHSVWKMLYLVRLEWNCFLMVADIHDGGIKLLIFLVAERNSGLSLRSPVLDSGLLLPWLTTEYRGLHTNC